MLTKKNLQINEVPVTKEHLIKVVAKAKFLNCNGYKQFSLKNQWALFCFNFQPMHVHTQSSYTIEICGGKLMAD